MVNISFPSNPADLPTPEPEGVESAHKTGLRKIIIYLFYILIIGLAIASIWYVQAAGYLTSFGF